MSDENKFDTQDQEQELDTLLPGYKKSRRQQILDDLAEIDFEPNNDMNQPKQSTTRYKMSGYDGTVIEEESMPSRFMKIKKKKEPLDPYKDQDEWFDELMDQSFLQIDKRGLRHVDFETDFRTGKKKKKKKKKKKDELTDYKKEFEPEAALFRNLLVDQQKFVDSLQKEYNFIKGNKATSRGMTKNLTDLIMNITSARNLAMQLVDKNSSLKKTIADLEMKERKEKAGILGEGDDLSTFASTYLKQMISERQQLLQGTGNPEIADYSPDEAGNFIDNILADDDAMTRESEIDKYLEYENRNVTIYVSMNSNNPEEYEFIAKDEDGNELSDYPLPFKGKMNINRSTNVATDIYGQHFPILWR